MIYGDERLPERFWAKVYPEPNTGCWLWAGSTSGDGHAMIKWQGKMKGCARLVLEAEHGVTMKHEDHACHHCDNPPCVNPDHLYIGNVHTNLRDRSVRGRTNRTNLTKEAVVDILTSTEPGIVMARKYSVKNQTISKIRLGQHWKHVSETIGDQLD